MPFLLSVVMRCCALSSLSSIVVCRRLSLLLFLFFCFFVCFDASLTLCPVAANVLVCVRAGTRARRMTTCCCRSFGQRLLVTFVMFDASSWQCLVRDSGCTFSVARTSSRTALSWLVPSPNSTLAQPNCNWCPARHTLHRGSSLTKQNHMPWRGSCTWRRSSNI